MKKEIEEEYTDLHTEEQAGFHAGRSTIEHLNTLTLVIKKKITVNQTVHLLFVNAGKNKHQDGEN